MKINNKKHHLSRIRAYFIMLLFVMCLTMNVLFCSTYNDLLDKTTVIDTWANSESVVANEDSDNTAHVKSLFLNKNTSNNETITKNISSILLNTDIPKEISLILFLVIVFLFFFLTLFILLPDEWTLINQKVRLDN